ncbi:MAG: CoA pyrophosphatase [Oscillospiraceae bacterium]|nr:CoA pyrophosphatase [Oscillospiraceae bacterium]
MKEIDRIRKAFTGYKPTIQGVRSKYAVLMPLIDSGDELSLLFEVRSPRIKRQPGEVCFPGGKMEPGEDPVQCALRETWEEIGIAPEKVELISGVDYMHSFNTTVIYPVLGRIDAAELDNMKIGRAEVDEVFTVPFEHFRTEPYVYKHELIHDLGPDFPYERIGFKDSYPWHAIPEEVVLWEYGGHPIWGLTAQIIRSFMRRYGKLNGEEYPF